MRFIDLFSDKAALYASARPQYPDALFEAIAALAPSRARCWDCGTGNGQAAVGLAKVFAAVEATDPSEAQIANGIAAPGVRYSVQPAEQTDFAAASMDAISVAQALHWFDLDRFYAEARRVLKPGGVLAAFGYSWPEVTPEIDAVFLRTLCKHIEPYWAPQVHALWDGYRGIAFPFAELPMPALNIELDWDLHQFMAYAHTWSATRRCIDERGDAFFEDAAQALQQVWGDPRQSRQVRMPLVMRAGRQD